MAAPLRRVADLARLRDRPRRLLAVFPHPDDESYGPAGALARLGADPEGAAAVFVLTRGEASSMGPARGLAPAEVAALRTRRLEEVARVLGLDALLVGDFPDRGLARFDLAALADAVGDALAALRPQVVVAHDPRGVNAHPDHIATHWALRCALLEHPGARLAMLAYPPSVAEAVRPRLLFPTPEADVDAILELDPREIEAKERCLRIHEAFVTLREDRPDLVRRPPVERYDFLGEAFDPPLDDLFARLPA